ncbi:hypothetical protein HDV62DRAFT_401399 [Trichoderma sp. SZMC 28011]
MAGHLLMTLPFPKPEPLLKAFQGAFPDLKVTFLRHEVKPAEAFVKQDMYIPPEILREATHLMTFGVVPDPADAPNLRYIHFSVAGTDHVAHKAVFKDPKITITTSTGGPSIALAEWIMGSVLGLTRQLFQYKDLQNKRTWGSSAPPPFTLDGKKMGIVGYGSIGRQVARLAQAFSMDVVVYNSRPRLTAEDRKDRNWYQAGSGDPDGTIPSAYFHGQSREELHKFLSQNLDILVLALPLTPATKHLIGEEELSILNTNSPALLVNVARGPVVYQEALIASLKKGAAGGGLLGAALDVTDPEPLPTESELWGLPNVFITPHISSSTTQTVMRAYKILQDNLVRQLKDSSITTSLNMTQSSCLCGANVITYEGTQELKFKCHCANEGKLTGASPFSLNFITSTDSLKVVKGELKTWGFVVDSGNFMTNHCCGECGSLLYRTSSGFPGKMAVKIGCVDDEEILKTFVPEVEIFTRNRPAWVPAVEGAVQNWTDFGTGEGPAVAVEAN